MTKKIALLVAVLFLTASCDQSHFQQAQVPVVPGNSAGDLVVSSRGETRETLPYSHPFVLLDVPKDVILEGRKKMIPAISAAFSRRTAPERAKWLAEVCYRVTEGTQFTPLDLAEIALAETGGFRLSSKAVSPKGALGVWQLMPERALSHGYEPHEMRDDEKCAKAAVRELHEKLGMSKGNLSRAKRLYCGMGRAAAAYEVQRRLYREELLREMEQPPRLKMAAGR